jgi:hypothetical protein
LGPGQGPFLSRPYIVTPCVEAEGIFKGFLCLGTGQNKWQG